MQNLVRSYIFRHLKNVERLRSNTTLNNSQAVFFSTAESKNLKQDDIPGKNFFFSKQNSNSNLKKQFSGVNARQKDSYILKTLKSTRAFSSLYQTHSFAFSTEDKTTTKSKSQILAGIKLEKDASGRLTVDTIKKLYDALVHWVIDDYTRIMLAYRKERRSLKTPKEYVEAYKKFVATFEKVLDEAQQEFLKGLNLDKKDFFGAAEAYMKEGNADIRFIYVDFANKLLASIPRKKSQVGISLRDVVKEQIGYIEKNKEALLEFAKYMESPERYPSLIQNKIQDHIEEKFGVEEEDLIALMGSNPKIWMDKGIQDLMKTFHTNINQLTAQMRKHQIVEGITSEKDGSGRLTIPALRSIYDAIALWIQEEYAHLVLRSRKERRGTTSPQGYLEAYRSFQEKMGQLLTDAQAELLQKRGISQQELNEAVMAFINERNQDFMMIHFQLPYKLNAAIPSRKEVHEGINFKEVVKAQIEYLQKNGEELLKFAPLMGSPDESEFLGLVQTKLKDHAFEKFGVEEEDLTAFMTNRPDIFRDNEVVELLKNLDAETSKIVQGVAKQ